MASRSLLLCNKLLQELAVISLGFQIQRWGLWPGNEGWLISGPQCLDLSWEDWRAGVMAQLGSGIIQRLGHSCVWMTGSLGLQVGWPGWPGSSQPGVRHGHSAGRSDSVSCEQPLPLVTSCAFPVAHPKWGALREGPWYMQLQPVDATTPGGLERLKCFLL